MSQKNIRLRRPPQALKGSIKLDGSKSISNRLLIIQQLCAHNFELKNISTSQDTQTLANLLATKSDHYDAGAAGTTFRFLTALLALQSGTQTLTGSERMKQRPIAPLVDALRSLGANIEYAENQGFPPLQIHAPSGDFGKNPSVSLPADVSSQFISALLLIAPTLPNGLELTLEGEKIVSRPYIQMTLRLMQQFGIEHNWNDHKIKIAPQKYNYSEEKFEVESDWSAASYYYAMAAFADEVDLTLLGLRAQSTQGDSVIATIAEKFFGIETTFIPDGIRLRKNNQPLRPLLEWDFLDCPDLAQTVSAVCAGCGINALLSGMETLHLKETDRVGALKNELAKIQVWLTKMPPRFSKKSPDKTYYLQENKAVFSSENTLVFKTYDDHRMAMSLAPLAMLTENGVEIEDPDVVKKSCPNFWTDLQQLGFEIY